MAAADFEDSFLESDLPEDEILSDTDFSDVCIEQVPRCVKPLTDVEIPQASPVKQAPSKAKKASSSKTSSKVLSESTNSKKPKSSKGKKTVEQIYQKKTQLEHILLRPDTYGEHKALLPGFGLFSACRKPLQLDQLRRSHPKCGFSMNLLGKSSRSPSLM